MRIILAAATACILSTATAAFAQTLNRGPTTQVFVNACVASPHLAGRTEPEPTCACTAGVLSGLMTDRQYVIAGRLTPFTGNDAGMREEIQRLAGEGYTFDEIMAVGQTMINAEALITNTCSSIDR